MTVFGSDYDTPDGTCIRDYIHVVDLAKAHVEAINYNANKNEEYFEALNVGTGRGHSVLEVIHTFESVTKQDLNYTIGPRRSGDIEKVYANTAMAEKFLNWQANESLETALVDAWNWEKKIKEA